MQPQNILGNILKIFAFLAVIGIVALAIGVILYSFLLMGGIINTIVLKTPEEGEVILKSLKAIDTVLLGVIFFIIGLGLFELFIRPIDTLPDWLQVKSLDDLKVMLIKVVVVVIGVSFAGRIVTWDGEVDLLGYGVGLAGVIFALSYFLKVKTIVKENKE